MRLWSRLCAASVLVPLVAGAAHAQLTFNLAEGTELTALASSNPTLYTQVHNGFQSAASRWSALLSDAVTLNITVNYKALGAGVIGSTSASQGTASYTNTRTALLADITSADDIVAAASLPNLSSIPLYLNYTSNNPNGAGSPTPYLDNDGDANNTTILFTSANAKAAGLLAGNNPASDGSITFSSAFSFDFDPSNGVTAGQIDFVGVATHEIGHALGFTSGVDVLDNNSTGTFFRDDQFTFVSSLDLFRYSSASAALGARDWTAGNSAKYFSIDGGLTNQGALSTGTVHGDGRQASHWKDNLSLGIMDPTAAFGELLAISGHDLQALDAIGWNLKSASIPEPGTFALAGLGLVALGALRRRSRSV